MSRMDRHRIKNKYKSGLDALSGDAETTQLATSGVAELLKSVGSVAASAQKKKEIDAANLDLLNAKAALAKTNADPKASADAKAKAQLEVDKAAAKLSSLTGTPAASAQQQAMEQVRREKPSAMSSALPWILGGLGVVIVGAVGYKLVTRSKK